MPKFTHPEDVKADIRKRYGSVKAFERHYNLPPLSVRDVLRGKKRARVARVMAHDLGIPLTDLDEFQGWSHEWDNITPAPMPHRQKSKAA